MDDQNKNLILATVLSFIVIMAWFLIFPPPETKPTAPATQSAATQPVGQQGQAASPAQPAPPAAAPAQSSTTTAATQPASGAPEASATAANLPRISIDTPRLEGSISVQGGRIDSLKLKGYPETLAKDSPLVRLLTPVGQPDAYYVLYGWAPGGNLPYDQVPGANTVWQIASGDKLTPENPVTLTWDNGHGLVFSRRIAVDDNYMFTVTQTVENKGNAPVTLEPYGMAVRHGLPPSNTASSILHEGLVQMADGKLIETTYKGMRNLDTVAAEGGPAAVTKVTSGWIGFTDKYWMTALIPEPGTTATEVAKFTKSADIYQTEVRLPVLTVAPGAKADVASRVFAGAKEYDTIRMYQNKDNVPRFVDSIDWGWFFFFTKPIYWMLHNLHAVLGNMGLAIIALVFVLKIILFPLAHKSYVSMARMKELQPEMEALKEKAGDDKMKLQKEIMQLYKEKKVNPAAGCLPVLFQIPIFFSLYKVITVTIELRQAPFYGWIRDLSVPDPTSWINGFGLLPFPAPDHTSFLGTLSIGVLPLLLGVTMWFQQKLNPAPADPTQKMIFAWMPFVFMFMLGHFASGLVLYYITNNTLTFIQQYMIMRSHGHPPDIFGNIKSSVKRSKPAPK